MKKRQKQFYFLLLVTNFSFAMQAPTKTGIAQGTRLPQIRFGRAGVLPVTYFMKPDPKGSKKKKPVKYALLSRESRGKDKGTYDAFSGSRERGQTHPVQTAAMELWEEGILQNTLGWSQPQTLKYIDLNAGNTELILVSGSVLYVTKFSTKNINKWRSKFYSALNVKKGAQQDKFTEKDRIAVVRWNELKNVINNARFATGVKVMARVTDPTTGKDKQNQQVITLRPILVKELRGHFKGWNYKTGKSPKIHYF